MKALERLETIRDPLEELLGFELRRTSVAVSNAFAAAVEPLGLRTSEATLLIFIAANEGCTQSDIARALRAQPANLVPLIQKLVQTGVLARAPADKRAVSLLLTKQGAELAKQVNQAAAKHEARIARRLSPETRTQVMKALRMICKDACCEDS